MSRRTRSQSGVGHDSSVTGRGRLAAAAAFAWCLAFTAIFLSRPLEHQPELRRFDLLLLLPELLTDKLVAGPDDLPSGWRFLPQRLDLFAIAALIAGGIAAIGRLALRLLLAVTLRRRSAGDDASSLDGLEWNLLAIGMGIAIWSLIVLICGLAGSLSKPLFVGLLLVAILAELATVVVGRRSAMANPAVYARRGGMRIPYLALAAVFPFLLASALGSLLPPYAFDVKEYHLGGPKEWYLDGGVRFLPHNVYTSFPQLTEMLSLSSMVVRGDWFRGALAGQLLLAGFLPLTGAAVFATGRRLFGHTAGVLAAVVYLTTPWAYQLSVMAYVEGGLSAFLTLAVLALTLHVSSGETDRMRAATALLTGVFAGSAMACKYPGVVQVVLPLGMALAATTWIARRRAHDSSPATSGTLGGGLRRDMLRTVAAYAVGVAVAVGPWLARNLLDTGNPVYPLLWTVFGGSDWDATLNAKWQAAHRPTGFSLAALISDLRRVVIDSGGQSLLVFGLAPLAFLGPRRREAAWLWFYLTYLLLAWWLLTHRIDRFWVPLLPVASLLAGAGAAWPFDRMTHPAHNVPRAAVSVWRVVCGTLFFISLALGFVFLRPQQPPQTRFLSDLDAAAKAAATPGIAALNATLPDHARVLLVGEAEIFDARFPLIYNTVFDRNLFEQWFREGGSDGLRSTAAIRQTLADRGVTHVYVNWREILRYRTTYGYSDFVVPERFDEIRQRGLLESDPPSVIQAVPFAALSRAQQREATERFESLIRGSGPDRTFIAAELYVVRKAE